MQTDSDVLIIGSGFGGCITACVLAKIGYRVCVVDKAEHPRFAIGESSTPLADRTLKRIAKRYDLAWLMPLTAYGSAQDIASEVTVGLKRGFSYFRHSKGKPYHPSADRSTELLVAASTHDSISDTHWLRSTVDQYIAQHTSDTNSNVRLIENFEIDRVEQSGHWVVAGKQRCRSDNANTSQTMELTSRFIIDASGGGSVLADHTNLQDITDQLTTNTSAVFGHFRGLQNWNDVYQQLGGDTSEHPYRSDCAAVHHLIDEGWLWQLGFDNGVTSCGIVLNQMQPRPNAGVIQNTMSFWQNTLSQYPALGRQFSDAELVVSKSLLFKARLQYLRTPAAGAGWLGLPTSVGFIDPLHSTGIAHTLSAVEKIGELFSACHPTASVPSPENLTAYSSQLETEIRWIDQLVAMAYAACFDFSLFTAATMTYFIVVTSAERDESHGFLATDNTELVKCVRAVSSRVFDLRRKHTSDGVSQTEIASAIDWIRDQVAPFNQAGLMDPAKGNLYHHTAPPDKTI